jgi:hypothetical protein
MSDGERPGGLTVLAVLSFIWAGLELLGSAFRAVAMATGGGGNMDTPLGTVRPLAVWILVLGEFAGGALLLLAAIGFLGMRRVMGRWVGTAYALVTAGVLFALQAVEPLLFNFGLVIGLVYAVLILLLVNTTFRHDLVR